MKDEGLVFIDNGVEFKIPTPNINRKISCPACGENSCWEYNDHDWEGSEDKKWVSYRCTNRFDPPDKEYSVKCQVVILLQLDDNNTPIIPGRYIMGDEL